jgi:hypothetical protein
MTSSTERFDVLRRLPWRFIGVAGRKRTTGFRKYYVQCLTTTLAWMVYRHRRDVFHEPIEACPASCVLVIGADGTCILVLSTNRIGWWDFPNQKVQERLDDGGCCWLGGPNITQWLFLWQRERTMNHGHGSCGIYVCMSLARLAWYVWSQTNTQGYLMLPRNISKGSCL